MMGAIGDVVDDKFINSKGIALLGAGTSGYDELLDDGLVVKSPWPAANGMLRDYMYLQHQPRSERIRFFLHRHRQCDELTRLEITDSRASIQLRRFFDDFPQWVLHLSEA